MKKFLSRLMPLLIILLLLLAIHFFSSLQQKYIDEKDRNNRQQVTIKKVVDWDTVSVILSWETISVRLIWIDTPEKTTTRYWYTECYWEESSDYLKQLLPKWTSIELEYDQTQWLYDVHDRILAYIFLSWVNINEKIIKDWYWWEYTYNLPYRYQSQFIDAEIYAKTNNLWLRNICWWERLPIDQTWSNL